MNESMGATIGGQWQIVTEVATINYSWYANPQTAITGALLPPDKVKRFMNEIKSVYACTDVKRNSRE